MSTLKNPAANQNEYATAITVVVSKCVEDCMQNKSIPVFPNQKHQVHYQINV